MNVNTRAGADAFLRLISAIGAQTAADFDAIPDDIPDGTDVRDYPVLAAIVAESLRDNFVAADPLHRQGFVRAIADLLAIHVDGAAPGAGWDPLKSSEAAFHALAAARLAAGRDAH